MPFDKLRIADWIRAQVELDQIPDPETKARIEAKCLALAEATDQATDCFAFAKEAELFWRGITYSYHAFFAQLGEPGVDDRDMLLGATERHYHPAFRQFLIEHRIPLDPPNRIAPVIPDEVAFWLAGGWVPNGWVIRHVYNTPAADDPNFKPTLVFDGKETSICAHIHGDHFTQSAGIIAVNPECEADLDKYPCLVKTLRLAVWQRFGYDPDCYFDPGHHNRFGFVV